MFHLYIEGEHWASWPVLAQLLRYFRNSGCRRHREVVNQFGARILTWDPDLKEWF